MKKLIDMNARKEIAQVDWEFIYEMQRVAPDQVSAERVCLSPELLRKIPEKWKSLREGFNRALGGKSHLPLAVADLDAVEKEFKTEGRLYRQGKPLGFCKLVVMDKDLFEDDFLGMAITGEDGYFSVSFDAKAFNDIPFIQTKQVPDFLLKLFEWKSDHFAKTSELRVKPFKVSRYEGGKTLIDLGTLDV